MKKIIFFIYFIIAVGFADAQSYTPPATIPPYHILTTDSVYLTPANLKKNKAVMVIYFSPDCGHCQHLVSEMKPVMKDFKNMQVIMITWMPPLRGLRDFAKDYNLKKYPNVILGTEGYTYVVQRYYRVRTTPYIAVYDKNGKLSQTFDKVPEMKDLVAAVKKV
jgi:thiol-disulfide isomerase/thioredoxin